MVKIIYVDLLKFMIIIIQVNCMSEKNVKKYVMKNKVCMIIIILAICLHVYYILLPCYHNTVIYTKYLFSFICFQRESRKVESIEDGTEMSLQHFKVPTRGHHHRARQHPSNHGNSDTDTEFSRREKRSQIVHVTQVQGDRKHSSVCVSYISDYDDGDESNDESNDDDDDDESDYFGSSE